MSLHVPATLVAFAITLSRAPPCSRGHHRGGASPRLQAEFEPSGYSLTDDENKEAMQGKEVKMDTSLGYESELVPVPGPPIKTYEEEVETQDAFALFSRYAGGQVPSAELTAAYTGWLHGSECVRTAHYLLSAYSFEGVDEEHGFLEIVGDGGEEAAAPAAAPAAAEAAPEEEAEEEAEEAEEAAALMEESPVAFVGAHLTVVRADSAAEVEAWAAGDPVRDAGGYASTATHAWAVSDDAELNMAEAGQCYCVYCLDRPGAAELRAATRPAHLEWLRESGRVHRAGPLLADGNAVGSLLFVNADDLADAEQWAADDPYKAAGLFSETTIAPLMQFAMRAADDEGEQADDFGTGDN